MARLITDGDDLVVRLSWWERVAARRWSVRVPRSAVDQVRVERDWWRALRGSRGPGIWVPGALGIGVRNLPEGRDFAVVRLHDLPVVCVELDPSAPYRRLAVSTHDPDALLRAVRRPADGGGPPPP